MHNPTAFQGIYGDKSMSHYSDTTGNRETNAPKEFSRKTTSKQQSEIFFLKLQRQLKSPKS